jgi:hypothetical protein
LIFAAGGRKYSAVWLWENVMRMVLIAVCGLMLGACADKADQQRAWRLYAVDKCDPVRSQGTPAFDRCVEDTITACQAGKKEVCKQP